MRILVVATQIDVPGRGGGQTHVAELVSNLRRFGGPTLLLARRDSSGPDVVGAGLYKGLPPPGLAHLSSLVNLPIALFAARRFEPDVIYERGSSFGLGAYLSVLLDIPMLVMLLDEHISPLSLRRARTIISTKPRLVPARFRHKTTKVSWGANTEHFRPDIDGARARRELGLLGAFVVGYTGTLRAWHGLDTLIDAAKRLDDPGIRFLIIGGSDKRLAHLKERIGQARLGHRFVLTGQVDYERVPALLAAADVCVAPFDPDAHPLSKREGYVLDPLKVFEYLAMAIPTITIRAENIEALFEDGKHLHLVPPRDGKRLADTIAWIKDHPERARKMARAGHEKVAAHHTWAAHARQLVSLFDAMRMDKPCAS